MYMQNQILKLVGACGAVLRLFPLLYFAWVKSSPFYLKLNFSWAQIALPLIKSNIQDACFWAKLYYHKNQNHDYTTSSGSLRSTFERK